MDNIQIVSLIDKFLDFYDSSESITDFKEKFKNLYNLLLTSYHL